MTPRKTGPRVGLWQIAAISSALLLLVGCDEQTDLAAVLGDFVMDLARNALAAFLL